MSFHFPGSATRPQARLSLDSNADNNSSSSNSKNKRLFPVENPLLLRSPATALATPVPSTPQHASPFVSTTPWVAPQTTPLNPVGLRQRKSSSVVVVTQPTPTPVPPPPLASLSTGMDWVPSLKDENEQVFNRISGSGSTDLVVRTTYKIQHDHGCFAS